MSQERFQWLSRVAGEVIATPGCESNVWEIFQKCIELQATRDNIMIFNQFDEFGNHLWHYEVTGHAMEEVLQQELGENGRYAGVVLTSGSSGTMGSGDYLKELYPASKLVVSEALQCPTLLENGFGGHRIEGIGDKHVPWIHNARNTDMVTGIDDEDCMSLIRLFNDPAGQAFLRSQGVSDALIEQLPLLGISSVANLLSAMKFAKYYELTEKDVVLTVFTDSMELYQTRLVELEEERGAYNEMQAAIDYNRYLMGIKTDHTLELRYQDRKRIHNLKYYTWIEQMGKSVDELDAQWYDYPDYWDRIHKLVEPIDELIEAFNDKVGLLNEL
jgi:cysteine synthase